MKTLLSRRAIIILAILVSAGLSVNAFDNEKGKNKRNKREMKCCNKEMQKECSKEMKEASRKESKSCCEKKTS